jgi:hypothetical protein
MIRADSDLLESRGVMKRIDGYYLYQLGLYIHPLAEIQVNSKVPDIISTLYLAENYLEALLNRSVFQLKTSWTCGNKLLTEIKSLTSTPDRETSLTFYETYNLTSGTTEFEHVLNAELGQMNIYLVSKKRGYDTQDVIHQGIVLFPDDLPTKVPESTADINQGTRCIAFELPTAAGFHLHRANEAVLHRYYDSVTNGAPRPAGRNIGDYLAELQTMKAGEPKVKSALRDLKDLHRNPLIHPEDSLESVDEAIALLGSIHSVVVHMLKAIPAPLALPKP